MLLAGVCLAACAAGCGSANSEPTEVSRRPRPQANGANSGKLPTRDAARSGTDASAPARAKPPRAPQADDWFEDATPGSGVQFAYRNGREAGRFLMIESFGGGAAMLDYDRDDQVDLFFPGPGTISKRSPLKIGGSPSSLYRNLGQWRFADVSRLSGIAIPSDYSQGCAAADVNGDGFTDLLVCAYGRSQLFINQGDGSFEETGHSAGLPRQGWATAAAFGDIDRDSLPDLMLVRYTDWSPTRDVICRGEKTGERDLCGPTSYPGTPCLLFHNTGDGRFEDWTDRLGKQTGVHGLGVVAADLNVDGWVDFFVSSDAMPNQLFLGGPDGLKEQGVAAGVAYGEWGQPEANMGIEVGDYDGDLLPDIFITHFENEDNALYRNLGRDQWVHATVASGLSGTPRMRVGFGTAMADFDSDGWQDIFVLNGNTIYTTAETPYEQSPHLFRNVEGKRFIDITAQAGPYFEEKHSGRGNLLGDLDNDGDPDLATVLMNSPARLLRNRKQAKAFVRVEPIAVQGERDATGAIVYWSFAASQRARYVVKGAGYFSQFDPRMLLPVDPGASSVDVTVVWPGRATERFRSLPQGTTQRLVEGQGEPQDAT